MATNPIPNTAMLSIRLDADALAALDSFAVGRGGRSAVVRQMIEQSVQEIADRPHIDRPDGAARNRVSLRFTDVEIAVIAHRASRSEEHTSELQSLMRISYAVFCLKKKKQER